jgi:glycerol-3-phosphate dehydrogenase (NAD(P)+)
MSKQVVILGAGEIGQAIGKVLGENKQVVQFWDKDPDRVPNQQSLESLIPSADILFLCIPSFAIRPAVSDLLGLLAKDTVIICLAKSIESETKLTMDEVLMDILPEGQPFAILSGPLLGEELESGAGGVAVVASKDSLARDSASNLFANSTIAVETTDDIHGAALCGVVKNIYAMGVGAAYGLGWGDNKKGWLAGKSMSEMIFIVEALGGRIETVHGASGFGDFIATGFSDFSGHHAFGVQLAKGIDCKRNKEGCLALPSIMEMLGNKTKNLPLLQALHRAITQGDSISASLDSVLYG